MTNPFEDESLEFLTLVNAERQHSLWPRHIEVPAGWTAVHGPAWREECLAYVSEQWTDMRPASLVRLQEGR